MGKILRAIPDLIWSFFPVFFLILVLSLFGKAEQIATRSDLVLGASVLFAEGWWKVRTVSFWRSNRAFFELIGFLGAVVAVILSTVMLLAEVGSIPELARVATSERFSSYQLWIEISSVLYALIVRTILLGDKEFNEEVVHQEYRRLKYLEERFPDAVREYEIDRYKKINPNLSEDEILKLIRI